MPAAVATALVTESAIFVVCAPDDRAVSLTFFTAARAAVVSFLASRFTRLTARFAPLLARAAPLRAVERDLARPLDEEDLRLDPAFFFAPPDLFIALPPRRPAVFLPPFLAIGSFRWKCG